MAHRVPLTFLALVTLQHIAHPYLVDSDWIKVGFHLISADEKLFSPFRGYVLATFLFSSQLGMQCSPRSSR